MSLEAQRSLFGDAPQPIEESREARVRRLARQRARAYRRRRSTANAGAWTEAERGVNRLTPAEGRDG